MRVPLLKPFLWLALDALTKEEEATLAMARALNSQVGDFGFKVNLDYLLKHGTAKAVEKVAALGRPVFADLKMWNGSRTMMDIVDDLVAAEVTYLNLYALADEMIPKTVQRTEGTNTKVLGVTVLTHYDDAYCGRHFRRTLAETVWHLTEMALTNGCHGIILPGTMLALVSELRVIKMVPAVRPLWFKDDRHKEEILPRGAVVGGATDLVCGSPVTKSDDPPAALSRLLKEIRGE